MQSEKLALTKTVFYDKLVLNKGVVDAVILRLLRDKVRHTETFVSGFV